MERPLFSCVVPVKGKRPFFDEAIASLRSQGQDEKLEIVIQDADIESDMGLSDALNRGFAKARGAWFFWLNADDVLLPGTLQKVEASIQSASSASSSNSPVWIAGNMVTIDACGRVIRCLRDRGVKADYVGRPIRVFGPSSFFRRELLEQAGGFDPALKVAMDTDLWLKFRECGHWFEKIGDYAFGFRVHPGSVTMNPNKSAAVQAAQDREVERVHAKHGVGVDATYLRRRHLRRLTDGSYLRELWDTWRYRGKPWQEVFT